MTRTTITLLFFYFFCEIGQTFAQPFICNNTNYLTYDTNPAGAANYKLYRYNIPAAGATASLTFLSNLTTASCTNCGGSIGDATKDINCLAYNPYNNYMYFVDFRSTGDNAYDFYKLRSDYTVRNVGQSTRTTSTSVFNRIWGLPTGVTTGINSSIGEFDKYGWFFMGVHDYNTNIYRIYTMPPIYNPGGSNDGDPDLSAIDLIFRVSGVQLGDIVYNPATDMLYTYDIIGERFIRLDAVYTTSANMITSLSNPAVSVLSTNLAADRDIAAMFVTLEGTMYGHGLNGGFFNMNPTTGAITNIGSAPTTNSTDGCGCPYRVEFTQTASTLSCNPSGGHQFSYTFTFYNRSGFDIYGVELQDVLSNGLTWNSSLGVTNISTPNLLINSQTYTGATANVLIDILPEGVSSFRLTVNVP
ncbi:MAG: hypothetical protein ACKVTZ_14060, partial [Bacteroidia bacterium]